MSMNTIHLHGALGEEFGDTHKLAVSTCQEAMKALCVLYDGFEERVIAGEFKVIRRNPKNDANVSLDEMTLTLGMNNCELHVIPVPVGSKKGGVGKVILGIALVGAAIITGGGALALGGAVAGFVGGTASFTFAVGLAFLGGAMILGGMAQMMMPSPEGPNPNDSEDENASFLFNGVVNVQEQGHPVPLPYGLTRVGSVVASSGLAVEQIGVYQGGSGSDNTGSNYGGGRYPNYPGSLNQIN